MKPSKHRLIFRHLNLILFICGIAFTFSVGAAERNTTENQISSADRIASILINTLPDSSTKSGLKRYYEILDPSSYADDQEVAVSNSGVANFFQHHFKKNACFSEAAYRFYADIRKSTRNQQKLSPEEVRNNRPSLGDKSGVNRPDLAAGWLYEKALKYSNGNSNAALTLIGLCGHDDVSQGEFTNQDVETKLLGEGMQWSELFEPRGENDDRETETLCPTKTADFFLPGSLSAQSDISDSLKRKILRTQYPGKKPEQIAAKNYHVLGAAFMTCQMIEAGMNPLLAIKVESMAANMYRGIRLCQNIEIPAQLFFKLQNHRDVIFRPFGVSFEDRIVAKALERAKKNSCLSEASKKDALCELLKTVGAPLDISLPRLEARAKTQLENYMANMVASGLYASWHISGEIAGISLPCSREQLFGPNPFMKWLVANANVSLNICGKGLSTESCKRAVKTITAWEVDFDWTVSQHVAGAQFAARVCKPLTKGASSMDSFCTK